MSSIGTFGYFNQARLGIFAAQKGLSVAGNNISNINTPGYTRQRLKQRAFMPPARTATILLTMPGPATAYCAQACPAS